MTAPPRTPPAFRVGGRLGIQRVHLVAVDGQVGGRRLDDEDAAGARDGPMRRDRGGRRLRPVDAVRQAEPGGRCCRRPAAHRSRSRPPARDASRAARASPAGRGSTWRPSTRPRPGVAASSSMSLETSKLDAAPRWTPPMPPVANIAMPARCAMRIVALTVVEASAPRGEQRAEVARAGLRHRPLRIGQPLEQRAIGTDDERGRPRAATVAGTAPASRTAASAASAVSRLCGDGQALRDEARLEGDDRRARRRARRGPRRRPRGSAASCRSPVRSPDPALGPGHARHRGCEVGGRRPSRARARPASGGQSASARSAIERRGERVAGAGRVDRRSSPVAAATSTDTPSERRGRAARVGDDRDRPEPLGDVARERWRRRVRRRRWRAPRRSVEDHEVRPQGERRHPASRRPRSSRASIRAGRAAASRRAREMPAAALEQERSPRRRASPPRPRSSVARPMASGTRWLSIVRSPRGVEEDDDRPGRATPRGPRDRRRSAASALAEEVRRPHRRRARRRAAPRTPRRARRTATLAPCPPGSRRISAGTSPPGRRRLGRDDVDVEQWRRR